jgi:hypothetical protein
MQSGYVQALLVCCAYCPPSEKRPLDTSRALGCLCMTAQRNALDALGMLLHRCIQQHAEQAGCLDLQATQH